MINIVRLSDRYDVHALGEADADEVLALCRENEQFYQYCEAEPTRAQITSDMSITPPKKDRSSKYYVGFYRGDTLMAVMDLIDGYPEAHVAYIGFFMMNKAHQGRGVGSAIVSEVADYLKSLGMRSIMLAIDKGNPQSTGFWKKNGFVVVKEVDRNGWTALVAQKALND